MSEPKHIWPSEMARSIAKSKARGSLLPRYTCTEGPEWDALMEQANRTMAWATKGDTSERAYPYLALRDLLAYFEEPQR